MGEEDVARREREEVYRKAYDELDAEKASKRALRAEVGMVLDEEGRPGDALVPLLLLQYMSGAHRVESRFRSEGAQ